jgi:N-acetylglucosaminyldiphosphoundecaprenol N-acetyl-beta-D-mannosaminyltransferase
MEIYQRKRDISFCGVVGLCAATKEQFVNEVFSLPVRPVSATVDFIGVPGVISAKENKRTAEVYNACTFAAMDGMPLVKAAKKKGIQCERCAGPNVMGPIFEESIRRGKTHYFYGGKDDTVLDMLKENLERDYPGIRIVGMYSPPFRPLTEEEDAWLCSEINKLKPDFLWVGIGAPKQEIWMQEHREKIAGTVMLGVGAAFNFFAGTLDKAPEWVEKAGLEWFYRLLKEPKRLWRRYVLGGFKWIYYSTEARAKGME